MEAGKKMSKTTIWVIVVLAIIFIAVILYFTVFKKSGAAKRETEPGTGLKPCDRMAPKPSKGSAKGEAGGYCIPPMVDLHGLNPNVPKDREDIFDWMKYAIENETATAWKTDNMGHLATVAAYQVQVQRAKK